MIEVAKKQNVIFQWLIWQFFDIPKNILKAWKNFLKFNLNYFSVPLLLKTFFSHWRRYKWSYGKGFYPGRYLEAFFSNMISRTLGTIIRSCLIFIGFLVEVFILLVGIVVFFGWLILPFLLLAGLIFGIKILF
jgi:hypothetical protein